MFINSKNNTGYCRPKRSHFFVAFLLLLSFMFLIHQSFFPIYYYDAPQQSVLGKRQRQRQSVTKPTSVGAEMDWALIAAWKRYADNDTEEDNAAVEPKAEEDDDLKTLQAELRHFGNVPESLIEQEDSNPGAPCSRRPSLYDISFNNKQWQLVGMSPSANNRNMYVFGAYLDTRVDVPAIRVIMMSEYELKYLNKPRYCQLWYKNNPVPRVQLIKEWINMWDPRWATHNKTEPYLFTCELPDENNTKPAPNDLIRGESRYKLPEAVSIVEETCDHAINELKVNYDLPSEGTGKKEFAICTKGLDFPNKDISKKLVDWIEMQRMLGVITIFFYDFALHPNVYKVLKFYEAKGIVDLTPLTLAGFQPNFPMARHRYLTKFISTAWKQEMVPYTDCVLKHMYKYNFIAAMDVDEVLLPRNHQDWKGLVAELRNHTGQQSYCFHSYYFTDTLMKDKIVLFQRKGNSSKKDSEEYPFMTNQLYKVREEYSVIGGKCLHDTAKVLVVHNHYPKVCLVAACFTTLNESYAIYHHHRISYDPPQDKLPPTYPDDYFQYDPVILKFKDTLKSRVDHVVREIAAQTDLHL